MSFFFYGALIKCNVTTPRQTAFVFLVSYFAGVTKVKPGERDGASRVRTTRPPTRRVLRPGVEKSTPFSGGRYQDDQPYHHLSFPLPCVPPSSSRSPPRRAFSSSRPRLTSEGPLARTLASGKKFRFSAAFCRGGATLAVKNPPSSSFAPLSSSASSYVNYPFSPSFLFPCLLDTVYRISFSIFRSILEYSRVRSQIYGNAHTHTHMCEKKRYTWLPDVSIKSTRQSTNFLTLKVKSRFFPLCLFYPATSLLSLFALICASRLFTRCVEMRSLYSSLFFLHGSEREVLCDTIACGTTASTPESLFFSLSARRALSRTHTEAKRFVCSSVQSVGQTSRTLMA